MFCQYKIKTIKFKEKLNIIFSSVNIILEQMSFY